MRAEIVRTLTLLIVGTTLTALVAHAETYQYTNPDGTISYSDNPYEAGIEKDHAPPETIIDMRGDPIVDEQPTASPNTPKKPTGVVPVGDPTYGYTLQGLTAITVTVRNDLDTPITDIEVAITLLDGAKERLDSVVLRGATGVEGRSEPGASVTLTGVADTPPDLITDQEVTTRWSNLTKNTPPPVATPEPTPTPTPTLKKEDLPTSRTQQKRLLKEKYQEQQKAEAETP